jgi:hypothetical protein
MRRLFVVLSVFFVTLAAISQASAATTQFTALAKGEFGGASPFKPCPTDPTLEPTCEVGHIAGYGKVSQVFTFVSGQEVNGCFESTGDVLWTLLDDPTSTLTTREVIVDCTPGGSTSSPGNRFHSFGNPFQGQGTYVITGGTGVFAGASGSGTVYTVGAGDTITIRYDGTITLP